MAGIPRWGRMPCKLLTVPGPELTPKAEVQQQFESKSASLQNRSNALPSSFPVMLLKRWGWVGGGGMLRVLEVFGASCVYRCRVIHRLIPIVQPIRNLLVN